MAKLKEKFSKPLLQLYDINKNFICNLSNRNLRNSAYSIKKKITTNDVKTLTFMIPFDNEYIHNNSCEYWIKFEFDWYIIKTITLSSEEVTTLEVYCEDEFTISKAVLCEPLELIGCSPKEMFDGIMSSTGDITLDYRFKGTDIASYRSIVTEGEISVFENLIKMAESFSAVLEMSTDKYGQKWIFLRKEPYNRGKVIRKDFDVTSLAIEYNTSEIFTRLMPFGEPDDYGIDLNIGDVNPTGKLYIENYSYYEEMGMTSEEIANNPQCKAMTVRTYDNITDPAELLSLATEDLKTLCKPSVSGSLSFRDLSVLEDNSMIEPLVYEKLIVVDAKTKMRFESIIQEIEYDYDNPLESNIVLNNTITYNSIFNDLVGQGEKIDKVTTTNPSTGETTIIAGVVQGKINTAVTQIGNMLDTIESPESVYAILFEDRRVGSALYGALAIGTSGILIAHELKEDNTWNWATAINSLGVNASQVVTGTLWADVIKAGTLSDINNTSWFNLEDGTFSCANGQLTFDGTEFIVKIGDQTINDALDSAFNIVVNKEHQIITLDTNSFPIDNGNYSFTFTVLKGNTTTETPCIINGITPSTEIDGVSFTFKNNTCTMKVDKTKRFLGITEESFDVELEVLDYILHKTISWSTVLQGRDGNDGVNGTNGISSYFHVKYSPVANPTREQMSEEVNTYIGTYVDNIEEDSTDPESYTWSRLIGENGQDGIPGTNGTDGKTTYLHIKYSDDMVSFTANNGETPGKYMGQYVDFIETDSLVFNDYIWAQIKGNDGRDGVDGTNGTPGVSSYFHVKYAPNNNPTASQMTDTPQEYMGTYVDSNRADSTNPEKYTWIKVLGKDGTSISIDYTVETLPTTGEVGKYYYVTGTGILWRYEESGWVQLGKIQGPQGIPGTNGEDGRTQYLHIKYSNDNGATFTTNNGEDVGMYIGTYVDFEEADSNSVSNYKWARIKGTDGTSASLVKIVETSRLFTMSQGATEYSPSSIALTPQFTNCTFGKWQYSTNGGSSWTNVTNGLNGLTISNDVLSISNTSALYTDSITSVSFKVTASDGSSDVTTITRLKDGIDGADGTDGKNGTNGVSATNIILGNENHTFQATSNGNAVATSITFDIDGYVGTTEKAVTVGTISGVPTGMTITKNGSGTTNASLIVKVTTSMTSLNGIVTIPCTCNGLTFNKQFTYSLSVPGRDGQDGINGTNGIDGTSSYFHIKYSPVANPTSSQMTETPDLYIGTYVDQSPTDSTDPSRYTWSKFQGVDGNNGRDGTPGVDGKDGTTYYLHIKYSNDGTTFTSNNGETPGDYLGQYVDTTKADSTTFSKYTWKKIKGDKGDQGIPGADGTSSYFHIKYSSVASPTTAAQMTETPSDYIGTYVDDNPTDSTDPSRYTWSRFRGQDGNRGEQGTPGINGKDGKTYYLHIKYSNDGTAFTSNNGEDPGAWLGQYVDTTEADSTTFSRYTWSKIRGDDGANASYVRIDETSQVFLKAKGATAYTPTSIKLTPVFTNSAYSKWQYSINNGSSWTNVTSGSNGLTISNGVLTVANTCNLFTSSVQSVIFKVTGTNSTADTITLVRIADGADGATPNFNILPKTNQGTTNWNWSMQYGDHTKTAVMEDGVNCCKLTRGSTAQSGWSVIEYSPINREKFKTNTKYTISVEVKSSVASSVNVQLKNGDSSNPITDGLWLGNTVANTWTKLRGTLATYSTFPASTGQKVYFTGFASGTGVSHMFRNLKIEEGTEATTWLPTVEELHGNDATVIQLSNENHTFAATSNGKAVASSITVDIYGFVGATAKATTIGTISGTPAGMTITKNNSGTTYASLTIAVTTSMSTTAGTVSIPITCNGVTFNKVFTYSLSVPGRDGANGADGKDGADGADGKNGTNASYVMASPTTQFFKCLADSTTYSPTSITITPSFVNCSYSSWQYSVDGGKVWANVTSGSNGLTISNGVLTIQSSSSLFTTSITSIAFKVNASGSKYDIVTISKLKDGNTGATGATGAAGKDSINIILGNENHTFAASSNGNAVATSVATSVVGYKGTTKTACTVGTISGLPTGMTATINSNGTTSASVTFTVTTSLTTKNGSVTIPVTCGGITINKIFSYSLAIAGANGTNGTNGTNAITVRLNATTNVFKSTDGGVTFSPSYIDFIEQYTNCSFTSWQYSTNGGSSWTTISNGSHGFTNLSHGLRLACTSDLFNTTVTAITIRINTNVSTVYDTLTVYKLYDRTDINDAFEQMKLTVTQSNTKWEAAFKNSNANNMLLNSDFKTGTSDDWIDNGGGISIAKANAFPFYGSTEYYLKTSFPQGVRYAHDVQLEPNTDYVYEGYIYVNASLTGTNITPLHFWIWKGTTPTSTRLCTIVDYRQTMTSGRFVKCYVHFKTDNVTEALYGRFFVYHTGTSSNVGVKRMSLKKGTVETEWTQHPNEVKSIVTSIDQDGVKVKHSEAGTYTQMDSTGFNIRDSETGDVFAWLSSKEQWTELKVDKVFANNVENVYEGDANLYVNHSATVAGDGTANKPFNSFGQLRAYLEATPVINKDLYITIKDPGFVINEQLRLQGLKGAGFIQIILEGNLVIANAGSGQWCMRFHQIDKWVSVIGSREFGSTTTGAVLCDGTADNGHGIYVTDVSRFEVDAITIACKNWGIYTERTHLYTWHVDFAKTWCAIELTYLSLYFSSDDVGSCHDFVRLRSGSFAYWGCGTVRPQGNVYKYSGMYYDGGVSLTPTASPRYPTSNPTPPSTTGNQTYTYTYNWTSHKTYAYSYSNWSDSDCKQGSWGNLAPYVNRLA